MENQMPVVLFTKMGDAGEGYLSAHNLETLANAVNLRRAGKKVQILYKTRESFEEALERFNQALNKLEIRGETLLLNYEHDAGIDKQFYVFILRP